MQVCNQSAISFFCSRSCSHYKTKYKHTIVTMYHAPCTMTDFIKLCTEACVHFEPETEPAWFSVICPLFI